MTLFNTLNLSFNHLYGEVLIGGAFSNITKFSLTKNKDLCGGIPLLKLPACPSSRSKKHNNVTTIHLEILDQMDESYIYYFVYAYYDLQYFNSYIVEILGNG
ncbi:unnamed protein product [Lupinus luteus]|uniref:Non-specific serine/threonine protein kinase n=1 Tax=Lupinus luteus TaxID=3873 RepID=A0AAV1WGC9_LUPLU